MAWTTDLVRTEAGGTCPGLGPGINYRAACRGETEPHRFAGAAAAVEDGRAVRDRHVQRVHAALPAGGRGRDRRLAEASGLWKCRGFQLGTHPLPRPSASLDRYRALAYAAALILAAIWVHLYWSHEAGPRYFFPIVLMAAPLAGWGLLQISAAIGQSRPQALRAADGLVGRGRAAGGDARREPVRCLGQRCPSTRCDRRSGPLGASTLWAAAKMLGPDGIDASREPLRARKVRIVPRNRFGSDRSRARWPVAAGRCLACRPIAANRRATIYRIVLRPWGSRRSIARSLPDGCERLQVLVRRTGGTVLPAAARRPCMKPDAGTAPRKETNREVELAEGPGKEAGLVSLWMAIGSTC